MSTLTRQKIHDFYENFKSIAVTFSKEIIQVSGLQAKQVMLKCASDFFPCVMYSTSFLEAKIVANIKTGILDKLRDTNNSASIKLSFKVPASGEQVAFLVPCRVVGSSPYNGAADMSIFTLQFSQRPPDDLIEIIGRILEANMSFSKRKDERIPITPESLRKLRFVTKDVQVCVQGVPRRCVLRDISFASARVIVIGVLKLLVNKPGSIKFEFSDPEETYEIKGKFSGAESIATRKDMVVLDMAFDEPIPLTYKVRLSEYLSTVRVSADTKKLNPDTVQTQNPAPSAVPQTQDTGAPVAAQTKID